MGWQLCPQQKAPGARFDVEHLRWVLQDKVRKDPGATKLRRLDADEAASCLNNHRSLNSLKISNKKMKKLWMGWQDSNLRMTESKSVVLPT